jgi:DNA-binding NtrC family response regulator
MPCAIISNAMRVLVVDDDLDQRELLKSVLESWGHTVCGAANGIEALELVQSARPAVMVTDLHMPQMDGFELMERLKAEGSLPPTIVLTGFGSVSAAVETVHKYGGFWFLEKPVDNGALRELLERALGHSRLAADNERLRLELSQRGVLGDLIGQSHPMQNLFALIRRVAPTNASVMITGESGSGKELVARAIHGNSPRSSGPFLALNCAAMPETLMESEVFGHEKGSFTGAFERKAGAVELAEGGTLFLDEVGEMPIAMQAKLLRVLEDLHFRRLGGKQELRADVRVLSATNRVPEQAIKEGKLREDLYYRLNVFRLELPALRERIEDVPLIADALIQKLNIKHATKVTHLTDDARGSLMAQRWEGNVRELRNVIERATILAGEGPIQRHHLMLRSKDIPPQTANASEGLAITVGMMLDEAERVLIEATLKHCANNKTRAAAVLGTSAKTLHAKVKQYLIEDANEPGEAKASRIAQ